MEHLLVGSALSAPFKLKKIFAFVTLLKFSFGLECTNFLEEQFLKENIILLIAPA